MFSSFATESRKMRRFHRINFFLSLLLAASIVTVLGFAIPSCGALACGTGATPTTMDCSIPAGALGNVVSLRDSTDSSNDTKTATATLDKSSYHPGDSGAVTINDFYANLSSSIQDTVQATLTSTNDPVGISIIATETGPSSSTFVGSFTTTSGPSSGTALHVGYGDTISVSYTPAPTYSPRFQLTFDNAGIVPGDAILSDLQLFPADEVNNNFNSVIKTVSFTLANGANLTAGSQEHIVIQYNNTQLGCVIPPGSGCDTGHLTLWISPPIASPFHTFVEEAAYPGNPGGLPSLVDDPVAKTVSFDIDMPNDPGLSDPEVNGTWLFVLAFETNGAVGGGSSGFLAGGLQFNLLAGI